MSFKSLILASACALIPAVVTAQMAVEDPYARAASAMAISGAAFMTITNATDEDDRLVAAASDIAERVELHTHIMEGDVMRMVEVEEGFEIPAGESIQLQRGGMHVMFLGLREPLENGNMVDVTLTFEGAGEMTVSIPVDNDRMPEQMGHGGMMHGAQGQNAGN